MQSPASQLDTIMQAGAGAGKTTALVGVFTDFAKNFLAAEKRWPRIVVTTFTRKATQELKERLLKKALEEQREDLFNYISTKSCVQISTIHGILNLFLSRYGSAMGLTPDYKIQSDSENRRLLRRIVRKVILEKPHLQEMLEEYDFRNLEVYLAQYFQAYLTSPNLTHASEEFFQGEEEKVRADLKSRALRIAQSILEQTDKAGWPEYLESMASLDWNSFPALESFFENAKKPIFRKASAPFDLSLHEDLEVWRDDFEEFMTTPAFRPEFWKRHERNAILFGELAKEVSSLLEAQKLENGFLSMADLETFAFRLIREHPECAQAFSKEWDFWMVDEYQDTSPLQVELMRSLIGDRPSFIVGDPQQSIYLFRGARSEVFKEKVQEVQDKKGQYVEKRTNYRSSPEVLKFINSYFTRLDSQFAEMEVAPDKANVQSTAPALQFWIVEKAADDRAESKAALTRVQEILNEGLSPEKICVLSRTHQRLEEMALLAQEMGVPFQLHSSAGFFERREVMDALHFLKFLLNPHDNANFVGLLRSPWFFMKDEEIIEFCHSYQHSFWRAAQKLNKPQIAALQAELGRCESLGIAWTLKHALTAFGYLDYSQRLDPSGRREANLWKIVHLVSQEERRPGFNFLELIESGLESLSTEAESTDADATPVIEPKRVNFMTVHASKGLQFDHVILLGAGQEPRARSEAIWRFDEENGLWTLPVRDPELQSMTQSLLAQILNERMHVREAEEFNRVLYVALTRAKFGITMLMDQKWGKKSWAARCPFNLDEGLHEEGDFAYVVRRDVGDPKPLPETLLQPKDIRAPWTKPELVEEEQSLSVTDLISSFATSNTSTVGRETVEALKRAQQGTEAHRFFEALKYSSPNMLRPHLPAYLQGALQYLETQKEIPLMSIIEQGEVEWGFAAKYEGKMIQGQIDLWGIHDKTLWVLDYKTGSQKYSEAAFLQMEIYAWALFYTQQVPKDLVVRLAAIYPLDKKIKHREPISYTVLDEKVRSYLRK